MLKAERHRDLIATLNGDGSVSVADMARRFSCSPMTIRRDLLELQRLGLLSRTHGGAVLDAAVHGYARYENGTFEERVRVRNCEKRAIAEQAARLVNDGDSLLINAGSTATAFARALRGHRNLHVVTNGLSVAMELMANPTTAVFMLPGLLDRKKLSTVLPADAAILRDLNPPSAFLGVVGVSPTHGPMMADPVEAAMNRAMIDLADEVTLLVDSSKFTAQAIYRIVPMDEIDRIITDDGLADSDRDAIATRGIDLVICPCENNGEGEQQAFE